MNSHKTLMRLGSLLLVACVAGCDTQTSTAPAAIGDDIDFQLTGAPGAWPRQALVSWWPADNHLRDIRGGNHLTEVLGDVRFVSGVRGRAFSFSGTGDPPPHVNRIEGAPDIDELQTLTLQAWVKLDATGPDDEVQRFVTLLGEKAVIRQDGENSGDRQLHFYMNFGTLDEVDLRHVRVNGILQTECFHHVVGTYDGSLLRAYLDGVQVGRRRGLDAPVADGVGIELSFGAMPGALHGALDDVMVFDRALDESEIQHIYNAGPNRDKCSPPVVD